MSEFRRIVPSLAHRALADEIIMRVARHMTLPAAELAGPGRGQDHITLARHLVWSVLCAAGLNPAEIARLFERNHSTITHALQMMERTPFRRALFERFSEALPSRLRPVAHPTLPSALAGLVLDEADLSSTERAWILAFVHTAYLGARPPLLDRLAPYHGRRLLADRPALDADVRRTMTRFAEIQPPRHGNIPLARLSRPLPWLEISR